MSRGPSPELVEHGRRRDALFERVRRGLEVDSRVRAAWLTGSFGRGIADEWSDLDLYVAVADDAAAELVRRDSPLFPLGGPVLLVQAGFPSEGMPKGTFWLVVYSAAIHIDWNIGPVSGADRPEHSMLLFDRAGVPLRHPALPPTEDHRVRLASEALAFFWAMAPIAIKYVGRGHLHAAIAQTQLLVRGYARLWRAAFRPETLLADPTSDNSPPDPEVEARLPRVEPSIDPDKVLAWILDLCSAVEELHPALAGLGLAIPSGMPPEVRSLADIARTAAARPSARLSGWR